MWTACGISTSGWASRQATACSRRSVPRCSARSGRRTSWRGTEATSSRWCSRRPTPRAAGTSWSGCGRCWPAIPFPTSLAARCRASARGSWGSRTPRCCDLRIYSRRSRRRWSGARRPSRTGSASASGLQPVDRIQGDAAVAPDLEVQVGPLVARPTAHMAQGLTLDDPLPMGHRRVTQVAVEAVVAAAVIDQHGSEVGAERSREAHGAAGDGADRRAGRRGDADTVPRDAGVVRARRGAELIHDAPLHGPVELTQVCGGDGGGGGGSAARFRLAAGPLEGDDAVVQALLVALELG